MNERWRQTFLSWARTADFCRRIQESREIVAAALRASQRPYVAFSGGKDSLAMLHLVRQQKPWVYVHHWDYGHSFVPRCYHEEILRMAEYLEVQLHVETSEEYERDGRAARNVWYRHHFGRVLPRLTQEGFDLVFVGIRAQESCRRRRRIEAKRELSPLRECWPLAAWTWMDVWAYIVSSGLPYLSWYDVQAESGVMGYDQSRFSTLFDPEFAQHSAVEKVLLWRHRHG